MARKHANAGKHRRAKCQARPERQVAPEAKKEATRKRPKSPSDRSALRELHSAERKRAKQAKKAKKAKGLTPEPVTSGKKERARAAEAARRPARTTERRPVETAAHRLPDAVGARNGPSRRVRLRRRLFLFVIGLLLMIALLGCLYYFTGIFHVRDIEVTGCVHLNPDYVRALSGISRDMRFFGVSAGEVREALASEYWVESVTIQKKLPLKLVIRVKERTPWASVTFAGRLFSVDVNGIILEELPAADPALPQVLGLPSRAVTPGDSIAGEQFSSCVIVLTSLRETLCGRFLSISCNAGGELTLMTQEGMQVFYGTLSDQDVKNRAIEAVMEDPAVNLSGLEYLDVSVPDHPVIKPR